MSFSENLKRIRTERNLTQEELAELLDVSRQAVSKWEQGMGYPEVEKLLLISGKLNVSLDELMASEILKKAAARCEENARDITITSLNENVIAGCYKVMASGKRKGGKNAPKYALFGAGRGASSFWGEPTVFLGWYADEEHISKEIQQIHEAMANGAQNYTLQYSAKTQRSWARVKIIND